MSMWKINRQETEATSTNLVNINNKKVEFATKNNQIFCTSLDIARVFEKRHTHILDIIKNYLNDEDMKEFNQPNFRLVNYIKNFLKIILNQNSKNLTPKIMQTKPLKIKTWRDKCKIIKAFK
ncbi:Rha family transcriptional regulator [Campylobacter jejuni]|nr:hypothetical protein [Campylobacter jejuni]